MAGWRLAYSLEQLRSQVDERYPARNKRSDGTIGDAAHRSRESDHNPWIKYGLLGIVSALDLTHDPVNGLDTWALAEHLRIHRDARIKYVISNWRIFSSKNTPWVWRRYTGANGHVGHIHVSVHPQRAYYDDRKVWSLDWRTPMDMAVHTPDEPDPDSPSLRPVLRRNSEPSDHVRTVQRLLGVEVDGRFGPVTEAAVRAFQRRERLLTEDGVVGVMTWRALDRIEQTILPYNYDVPRPLSEPEDARA